MTCVCPYCGGDYTPPPLKADLENNFLMVEGCQVKVAPMTAEFFSIVLESHPASVTVGKLAAGLWGVSSDIEDEAQNVRVHAYNVRKALKDTPWMLHHHHRREGYRLEKRA